MTSDTDTELHPAVAGCVHEAAATIAKARRWRRWVEVDDVTMELWAWVYAHPGKTNSLVTGDRWWLVRRLRTVAERYARKEKAARTGYHPGDEYFYTLARLRALLPDAMDPHAIPPQGQPTDVRVSGGREDRWQDWECGVADVRAALGKISFADYLPLRDWVAGRKDATDPDVATALRELQRRLGGTQPRGDTDDG